MDFRTQVSSPPSDHRINYRSGILFMGSCFSEYIGYKMEVLLFPVDINPFGIVYNPSSASRNLWALFDRREYTKKDLHRQNETWFSFDHHSRFSHPDPDRCLEKINQQIRSSFARLKNTGTLILTWGTAWVYVHRETADVVSNCHKVPAGQFRRYLLTVSQVVETYTKLLARLRKMLPDLHVMLTISPVRHWKDGARMNTVSKSTLILAAYQLCERFSFCEYFPSYEIAMDDLRDYRFYADDLLHPNNQMINYIWEKFSGTYFDDETRQIMAEIRKLNAARDHRPFHPDSSQYIDFCRQQVRGIAALKQKYPFLALDKLESYFNERLKR